MQNGVPIYEDLFSLYGCCTFVKNLTNNFNTEFMKYLIKLKTSKITGILKLKFRFITKYLLFSLYPTIIFVFLTPSQTNAQSLWDWVIFPTSIHTITDVGIGTPNIFVPDAQLHIKKIACDWVLPNTGPVAFQRFELDVPSTIITTPGEPPMTTIYCTEKKRIWDIKVEENGLYFQHLSFSLINNANQGLN